MQRTSPGSILNFTGEPDGCAPLNVVIVYEDVTAGQHAMRTLAELTSALADRIDLHPQAWRLDLLENPDWRGMATADVIKADMLIISLSSDAQLSPVIENWVKDCLAQMHDSGAAVVALLGTADHRDEPGSPRFEFVQDAARGAGFDFFAPLPRWGDSLESRIEDIHRRAETVTETLEEILHPPAPRWHLNA